MAHHLTDVQLKEQQRQTAEQEQAQQDRKQDVWTYHTQRELEADDPSLKDGLDPIKLKQWRRQIMKLLSTAGMNLKIPQWGIAAAALLCHRFFSRKSMKRNDRFVIATACLHLAAKMEESPKPIREVVKECLKVVHGRQSAKLKKATEPDELEKYKEETLVAERAVLYTLGFNLNINHPYRFLVSYLSELGLLHASTQATPYKHLMQNTWNFLNDSFRSTLCLQYSAEMICSGALFCANELNKRQHGAEGDLMIVVHKTHPNATFFSHFNITLEQAEDIAHQILTMYEDVKISSGSKPSTSAPQSAGNTPSLYSPASPSTVQGD